MTSPVLKAVGPEFRRYLWIKFSPFSLAVMPLLIALGFLGAYLAGGSESAGQFAHPGMRYGLYNTNRQWPALLVHPALAAYFLATILYGCREASQAFTDELKNNTWDLQRMSSISAWHLLFGKLFGATAYAWYFGIALLATYAFGRCFDFQFVGVPPHTIGPIIPRLIYPGAANIATDLVFLILAALSGFVIALLGSLNMVAHNRTNSAGAFIVGFIVAQFISGGGNFFTTRYQSAAGNRWQPIDWYGFDIPARLFFIGTILFFLFWAVIALHSQVRRALRFPTIPAAWVLFTVAVIAYACGLTRDLHRLQFYIPVPFLIAFCIGYSQLCGASDNLSGYLKTIAAWRAGDWRKLVENLPIWVPSAILMLLTAIWAIWDFNAQKFTRDIFTRHVIGLVSFILLMARDGLVLHALRLDRRWKNSRLAVIVYYIVMYVLLPFVFALGRPMIVNDMSVKSYAWPFFYPNFKNNAATGLLPGLIEIAAAGVALYYRLAALKLVRLAAGASPKRAQ